MLFHRCINLISQELLKFQFYKRLARISMAANTSNSISNTTNQIDVEFEEVCVSVNAEISIKDTLSKRARKRMEKLQKYKEMKKKIKPSKNTNPGFSADFYKETDYYFENGLRKVYPYYFTFTTYAKFRWQNRTILDVLSTEFKANTEQDYKNAIENGTVTVNGQPVTPEYRIKNNDLLANKIHRHENPVLDCHIEVIANTDDILVINKPSSIPCHPCGLYRHNSIVFILGKELGLANLTNIYRLDRLTSGVLIMGKSKNTTKQLEDQIVQKKVQKEYVCRVVGNFPNGRVEVKEPLGCLSKKIGLFRIKAGGKESHTTFEKICFNGKSSVVKCIPHTGRTHQIRIHLQFLGHPIVNDPFYNSEAWGKGRGKGGVYDCSEDEIVRKIMEKHYLGLWEEGDVTDLQERLQEIKADQVEIKSEIETHVPKSDDEPCAKKFRVGETVKSSIRSIEHPGFERSKWVPDPVCDRCKKKYCDPSPHQLVLYLHALKYKGPDWEYSTALPDWAKIDWSEN